MIFKSRRSLEEEIQKRVIEIEERNRNDRHFIDLDDQVRRLTWRVDALEERLNPSPKTPVTPAAEEYPATCAR